ncbi:YbjN domain-containing protein [Reinekea blandensis]|uniref:Sensory transduction regulator n=1 Tax=Reinekea blandensis MED297 TaxID=314283 RepID=A4BJU4_9GAMM|nr:YbjN domain-containing protein [Reinekea blandensis]EAR07611.1 hypothetical protein MED297_00300 [Reinekea sp. MED297] [Reinekea blandensis MED297]
MVNRKTVQTWIEANNWEAFVCQDCEGIHLPAWEGRDSVLESRCFVETSRLYWLTEIAIRPSAVLPLQGAVHFMNYDYGLLKVMIAMADDDVPRLLLTHALPVAHLNEQHFVSWMNQLNEEMEAVYKHLAEMDVLLPEDNDDFSSNFDDQLH